MQTMLVAIGTIGVAVVFAASGVQLTRRFLHHHVAEGHNDVLVPLFLTAGTLYAVLLGFLVIAVWESYGNAHENVSQEAAQLVSMYRLTQGMEKSETDTMQRLIRE